MTWLRHGTTPRAIAQTLLKGPMERAELLLLARILARNRHAAWAAIQRLEERGLITCEFRLTALGDAVLKRGRYRR